MKKITLGILIPCLYCFPFVYFSMNTDFTNGSMSGYFMMIVLTSILAYVSKRFSHVLVVIIGNFLSTAVSFYFIRTLLGNAEWYAYFKPLSPYQLLVLVTMLNGIPQLLAVKLAKRHTSKFTE